MIIGVSHCAVRTAELENDRQCLESRGWVTAFTDHEVLVHASERAYLSPGHPEKQSIALLRHPGGLPALELVHPVSAPDAPAHYTELSLLEKGEPTSHGVIHVPDLAQAMGVFADGLGFQRSATANPGTAALSLRRPLPQWSMDITLVEDTHQSSAPPLDARGWFVLAFLSTDVSQDLVRLNAHGARTTAGCFVTIVNGRNWKIALCLLASGFAIELMQPYDRSDAHNAPDSLTAKK